MQLKRKPAICSLILLVIFAVQLNAQTIENTINLYGANFPQEKIHIHFDKESYLPGETIWFKAYLFEENLPSARSTNFYAALYDDKGKMIQQHLSPVFGGSSDGHFTLPDTILSSQVICRAYTSWMLNFDTTLFFNQAIKITNFKPGAEIAAAGKTVSLHFFPEGGDIIEGTVNTIAFKANFNNGLPFNVEAVIKKLDSGEELMTLTALHDGMGKFDLDFKPGDKYYVEWVDNNGVKQKTKLPDAKPAGVSLRLAMQQGKLYYNIINKTGNDSLHVLMYMYQKVFYKSNLKVLAAEPFTALIPVAGLPAGTMQLTVFDANWQPVAERVAFINNNFSFNAALIAKEISTQKRGKNTLEILVADTIPANMSLSITDADMNDEITENSIISNFLLKGDLKGYIHNPAYYFTNSTDADVSNKLDLVMLTHGWRRYNWADMQVQKMPAINFQNDDYLKVYGQIGDEAMKKKEKDEFVNLILRTVDSTNIFYAIQPDKTGFLKQTGLVFYDSVGLYFTFNKSKLLNKQMSFSKLNYTLTQPASINNFSNYLLPDTGGTGTKLRQNASLFTYYAKTGGVKLFNEEKDMLAVVLKTRPLRNWQNDPLLKLDDRYATGLFSGGATGYSVDVLHDEKAWAKLDFYNYLRGALPFLQIGSYNLESGRAIYYVSRPVLIYIDERPTTTSELEVLSITQVAYIKFIPRFIGGEMGLPPVLSVYTKKGDDLIDRRPKETDLNMVKIAGYAPTKQFYSPDYSQNNTTSGVDARTTLLWMPYILTDASNRKVPISFYNNDFTKKMRIVLEGINEDGKLIRIEKIVE